MMSDNKFDLARIQQRWSCLQSLDSRLDSEGFSDWFVFRHDHEDSDADSTTQKLLKVVDSFKQRFDHRMNFYHHNCQHFSRAFHIHCLREAEATRTTTSVATPVPSM